MKETYEKPYLEEIYFQDTDILTTSSGADAGIDEGGGED